MRTLTLAIFAIGIAVAGCTTYPDQATHTIRVAGDYAAISDCVYAALEKRGARGKTDLSSRKTSSITIGDDSNVAAKLEFIGISAATTEARVYLGVMAFGETLWTRYWQPAIRSCAG